MIFRYHAFLFSLPVCRLLNRIEAQAPQAQNTWCMRQLVYEENCMGKSPIVKKNVSITISFEIKFS